jgi:hypothetical protein
LDFLGFPWILSSESRLFNGLREISGEKNFARPFLRREAAGRERAVEAVRKGGIVHEASLPWFLVFCKRIVALLALGVGDASGIWAHRSLGVMAGLRPGHPRHPAPQSIIGTDNPLSSIT